MIRRNRPLTGNFVVMTRRLLLDLDLFRSLEAHLAAGRVVTIPADGLRDRSILQSKDAPDRSVQEVAVVRNDQDGPIEIIQGVLQHFSGGDIQIVGRFVEQ
jgi:hypothetical protein